MTLEYGRDPDRLSSRISPSSLKIFVEPHEFLEDLEDSSGRNPALYVMAKLDPENPDLAKIRAQVDEAKKAGVDADKRLKVATELCETAKKLNKPTDRAEALYLLVELYDKDPERLPIVTKKLQDVEAMANKTPEEFAKFVDDVLAALKGKDAPAAAPGPVEPKKNPGDVQPPKINDTVQPGARKIGDDHQDREMRRILDELKRMETDTNKDPRAWEKISIKIRELKGLFLREEPPAAPTQRDMQCVYAIEFFEEQIKGDKTKFHTGLEVLHDILTKKVSMVPGDVFLDPFKLTPLQATDFHAMHVLLTGLAIKDWETRKKYLIDQLTKKQFDIEGVEGKQSLIDAYGLAKEPERKKALEDVLAILNDSKLSEKEREKRLEEALTRGVQRFQIRETNLTPDANTNWKYILFGSGIIGFILGVGVRKTVNGAVYAGKGIRGLYRWAVGGKKETDDKPPDKPPGAPDRTPGRLEFEGRFWDKVNERLKGYGPETRDTIAKTPSAMADILKLAKGDLAKDGAIPDELSRNIDKMIDDTTKGYPPQQLLDTLTARPAAGPVESPVRVEAPFRIRDATTARVITETGGGVKVELSVAGKVYRCTDEKLLEKMKDAYERRLAHLDSLVERTPAEDAERTRLRNNKEGGWASESLDLRAKFLETELKEGRLKFEYKPGANGRPGLGTLVQAGILVVAGGWLLVEGDDKTPTGGPTRSGGK